MYEDPSNKRDWGWIAFQFGGALIGDRINARAWNMGDHTLLPEYQMSDWEMSRLKNSPPVLVSDGFSNTGGQSWIVQLAGMGGNLTKKPNEPIRFNLLGNNENKSYTIEGASYAKGNHYDWKMMVVCPSDTRPRLPEPENPEPEDDDMSCRYLKDQQQIVTVDVFDEKTGNFIPTKIRAHEAMIDVPKYLSEEMKKINKRLDAIFKTLEAGELQSQNGMLFDPKEQIAISKDVIAKNKAVRARTRRDIEVAIASQNGDAIAAVPEWWANRVGSNRPQLIVQYAEKLLNGSYGPAHYAITIPHYDNKKQENKDPDITNFSDYEKGSFMAICTMPDNSKLLVNCKTADEGRRTIGMLIKTTKFQLDDCELTISERKGQSLKETRVYPRVLKYFSQGQKDPKPDWIYYFK
jgi:hypothetical protein